MMEKVNKMKSDKDNNNNNNTNKILTKIGNYKTTCKILGKGHFAKVIEAYHTILKIKVAIKIIKKFDINDPYVRRHLKRETKIMSTILHPNIIFLFEAIETTQHYYIITELGSGGDLCNFIKSQHNGKLDERRARPLAKQLVYAIGHLHERGIVHRDLKMENILLDNSKKKIKIVDFGLSNFYTANELLRTHCGSPEYAAPELYIKGRKYGPEVDIWSLGIIFYGMLVGKLPFQSLQKIGVTQTEKKKYLMNETISGLTLKHHKIMVDLELTYSFRNLISKMLNPDPTDRIKMIVLQSHAWIYDSVDYKNYDCGGGSGGGNGGSCNSENKYIQGFPAEDRNWRRKVTVKIADYYGMKFIETYKRILELPYGPIGGIYNIEKFLYFNRLLNENNNNINNNMKRKEETFNFANSTVPNSTLKQQQQHQQQQQQQQRPITLKNKNGQKIYSNDLKNKTTTIETTGTVVAIPTTSTNNNEKFLKNQKIINNIKNYDQSSTCTITPKTSSSTTKTRGTGETTTTLSSSVAASGTATASASISNNKPNKSASIKMINYLNAKISQALGIYSARKYRKLTTGLNEQQKQQSTTTTTTTTTTTSQSLDTSSENHNFLDKNRKNQKFDNKIDTIKLNLMVKNDEKNQKSIRNYSTSNNNYSNYPKYIQVNCDQIFEQFLSSDISTRKICSFSLNKKSKLLNRFRTQKDNSYTNRFNQKRFNSFRGI